MSLELQEECPQCGEARTFWKTASTKMHLGTKRKWDCSECGFGIVRIDGTVDTSTA